MLQERFQSNAWYRRTTQSLFAEVCLDRPDRAAVVFNDTVITYGALKRRVDELSLALIQLGVGPGDVVSTLPIPTPEFTSLYFATLQVGAIVNPLNLLWGGLDFEGVLPRNNPSVIVTVDHYGGRDYIETLRAAIPDLTAQGDAVASARVPNLRHLVSFSPEGRSYEGFWDFGTFAELGRNGDAEALAERVRSGRPTDIQFMCQTSGTTGLSKSALWDHRPPLATVNFAARHLCYTEADVYLNLSPFYHNSGLFGLNLNLALTGSTLHLMDRFDPVRALDLIERHGVTATFGFDAHFQGIRRVPDFENRRFGITKAVLAGEPRSYDLVRDMCPDGATITNLYAQTENGPLVSLGEYDCMDERILKYTHGRPLPGVEVVIKDIDSGERVVPGEAGEICYRSPYLFRGYHAQPEETSRAFDDEGYFHSGDFGTFDNGYVTFLGRLGGVIKSGGENVSTVRVTNILLEHFGTAFDDVKAVGVDDPYWGTKLVAFVRPAAGTSLPRTEALRVRCKGALADYEIPKAFLEWVDAWPTTPEGKVDFQALAREALRRLDPG